MAAYINVTLSWIPYLSSSASSRPPRGPEPPNNSNRSLSFIPHVIHDSPPFFKGFGDVKQDVEEVYHKGAQVTATFVGANPRNNLRLEQTYAVVEKFVTLPTTATDSKDEELRKERPRDQDAWKVVRDDGDWHLVFRWRRTSELLGTSEVDVTWETAADPVAEPGRYRLRYFGDAKGLTGKITPFEGVSGVFELVEPEM